MRRTLPWFCVAVTVLACALVAGAQPPNGSETKPVSAFDGERYLGHIKYLASDELGGRGTGSEGIEKAADYIVQQFQDIGCEPGGVDGTWFQPFEVRAGKKLFDEEALLEVSGLDRAWNVRQDWIPFPQTAAKNVEGPLAFGGYGIQATEFDYDDYDGFDAEGKVLLILRYEPKASDTEAKFGGETPSSYATFVRKTRTASKHGAKALLIVNPPNRDPDQDELYGFNTFAAQQTYHLPMAHITRAVAEAILRQAGLPDLKALEEKLDTERKPLSKDLGLTVKLHPGVKPNLLPAKNVLAWIRGDGQTEDTIVVGAHYDHLGTLPSQAAASQPAEPSQTIFNGADDNASGTAGVIELARAIKHGPPLRRNILFMTFSGEEMGLLGSAHFVEHPTVDLAYVRAMVNLDMIGRMNLKKFRVYGSNSARELPDVVKKAAEEASVAYRAGRGMAGGSDHASFIRHGIPALFLFTGTHKQYHQAEDDWELIDADGATHVLQMAYDVVVDLANMTDGPTFSKPTREQPAEEEEEQVKPAIEEQREAAESVAASNRPDGGRKPGAETQPARGGRRVRLGIVPDTAGGDQPGLGIEGVVDGSPAKAAGMQEGDRIIKIGDEEVRDVYGYMRAMERVKPGDEVDVTVERKGEQKTIKVKFPAEKDRKGNE